VDSYASWCPLGATGEINLHGSGQIVLSGSLCLSGNPVASGTLNQDGGTLTVPKLDGGKGTYTHNFTGGTLNVSEVANMDLANNGGRVNLGGPGAVTTVRLWNSQMSNNIALGKTATMSSTWEGLPPENAVDGDFSNYAHNAGEENAWWMVDLTGGGTTSVHDVILTARCDGWSYMLSNFYLRVLDDDGTTVLYEDLFITDVAEILEPGENFWVSFSPVNGRYVQVQTNGYNLDPYGWGYGPYLAITECQVGDIDRFDYSQVATATLGVELDPTNELCDKLVAGTVTLAGTLDVTALAGDFAAGQVYDILDWNTLVGTFDTVNLPALAGGLAWDTDNLYVTGELAVVSTGPQIPGDTDGDNIVDDDDAAIVAQNWGQNVGEGGYAAGDFNGDHVVNAADAAIQVANWGSHVGESTGVPEPGALVLLLMGAAALLGRRGRRAN